MSTQELQQPNHLVAPLCHSMVQKCGDFIAAFPTMPRHAFLLLPDLYLILNQAFRSSTLGHYYCWCHFIVRLGEQKIQASSFPLLGGGTKPSARSFEGLEFTLCGVDVKARYLGT